MTNADFYHNIPDFRARVVATAGMDVTSAAFAFGESSQRDSNVAEVRLNGLQISPARTA